MNGRTIVSAMNVPAIGARAATFLTLALLSVSSATSHAKGSLDALGERLTFVSDDGARWARISGVSEFRVFAAEAPPPGLLLSNDDVFLAPRLSLTVDAGLGERLVANVTARADRGFDPGADEGGDVRVDEYYLQVNPLGETRAALRIGKFATAFGAWVDRHLAWDNPLVTAPAIYDDMVAVTAAAAPAGRQALAARRNNPENKDTWSPVVWGPSYASGGSVTLGLGSFDLVVEVKNAALSSHPDVWEDGFDTDPTFTGRLGWHPAPEWSAGVSFSHGPYLRERAAPTLPANRNVDDFAQTTTGLDLSYERHHVQVWAEIVHSRFDMPRVGEVEMAGGFVEMRYKPTPRLWVAGRLNHSWFDDIPGLDVSWDRDLTRADVALGFRQSAHLQGKLQYSFGNQAGNDTNGRHLFAAQVVLWF